jgi:hypothetical protein
MKHLISVRSFRLLSWSDFWQLKHINDSDPVRQYLVNVKPLSILGYYRWVKDHHPSSLLYAITYAKKVHGFVYFYWGKDENLLYQRLIQKYPSVATRKPKCEMSFARHSSPIKGFMRQGIGKALVQVKQAYRHAGKASPVIFASIDPRNPKAIKLIKALGFTRIGTCGYTETATTNDVIYLRTL